MKCPKCDYLGFETGDRCKNCGYDFSLVSVVECAAADYDIHPAAVDDVPVHVIDDMEPTPDTRDDIVGVVDDRLTISLTPESPFEDDARGGSGPIVPFMGTGAAVPSGSALPLFTPTEQDDDEPLIKLPAAPRPPLAVRRTPDTPRLRAVPARRSLREGGPRPSARPSPAPVLQFAEEIIEQPAPPEKREAQPVERVPSGIITGQSSRPGARVVAVLIDHLILLGIDAAVVYFTLRMAGLPMSDWRLLPVAPMVTFLGLLKVSYFYAFTAVGGQTIGKMAVGTCVVADNGLPVDAARAARRTSAGVVSFLLLGLGFIPALFGDHRALHDRLAGTRVVRLRSV